MSEVAKNPLKSCLPPDPNPVIHWVVIPAFPRKRA
jgi:hypothetical protein